MTVQRVAKSAIVTGLQYLAAFAVIVLLMPSSTSAFTLEVIECGPGEEPIHRCQAGNGAALNEFTYLINADNTNVPTLDERAWVGSGLYPPEAPPATGPMASHSPVVAAGDDTTANAITLSGDPDECGQAASYAQTGPQAGMPNGCRYLISVRATDHKWWGRHITVLENGDIRDSDGNDLGNTVKIALQPNPLPLSNLEVLVFEDFRSPNGFPDHPSEVATNEATGETFSVTDMSGFHILLKDVTGEVVVDADGAPLCGTGVCLTDARGRATIENLFHGKYDVFAIPPGGSDWIQTTTFEGGLAVDAWLEEGSDGTGQVGELLQEPGVDTAHFFGFVSDSRRDTACGGSGEITGTVRNLVPFPPFERLDFGEPVSRPWIVVSDLSSDTQVCVKRGAPDGTFSVSVPPGLYQVMILDQFLDYINAFYTVGLTAGSTAVPGQTLDPDCTTPQQSCSVGMFRWFGWNSGHVFLDTNGNSIRDPGEIGIPGLEVAAKFRDGSGFQGAITDSAGFYEMNEIRSPLGKMFNLEVDFGRFNITGHSAHDEQFALFNNQAPIANRTVVSPDVGGGLILSQQTWEGRRSIVDWGKSLYQGNENGGISGIVFYATTRNEFDARLQAVEDYEPGIPNVTVNLYDLGTDGAPGGVGDAADVLVNTVQTDNWQMPRDDNLDNSVQCDVRDLNGAPLGGAGPEFVAKYCIEVPQAGNHTHPGAYDGGWAFGDICDPAIAATGFENCQEGLTTDDPPGSFISPIPPRDYVVEVVPPPFYQVVKEEDLNVTEGNAVIPQLPPPPCVGDLHFVPDMPDYNSPFEEQMRPLCDKRLVTLQAQANPGLDIFLMHTDEPYDPDPDNDPNTNDGLGTSWESPQVVPPPARFMGLVEDDIYLNLDPNSITYGELRSLPGLPIGVYEFSEDQTAVGRRLTTVFTDSNGFYEVLLPATFAADAPIPSGVPPSMYVLVVNDPGPDPANPNPGFSKAYLTEPAVFESFPGKMRHTDTPVDPISALSCGVPPDAPQIFQVSTPVADAGADTNITITGMRFGNDPLDPPDVFLVDSSGTETQLAVVDWFPAEPFTQSPIFEDEVVVTVPGTLAAGPYQLSLISGPITGFVTFPGTGPLSVSGGGLECRNCLTVHVTGGGYPAGGLVTVSPPSDPSARVIQSAIDGAGPETLIVIAPGTYRENVILHQKVKLQGYGPGGAVGVGRLELQDFPCPEPNCPPVTLPGEEPFTHIPGSVIDGRFFAFSAGRRGDWEDTLADFAPYSGPTTVPAGAAITVVVNGNEFGAEDASDTLPPADPAVSAQIDGLGITTGRGEASGGIYVHAHARNLIISNNILDANQGSHGGAISLGQPQARGGAGTEDHNNDDVRIHHNRIVNNGGVFRAGAIGIFAGAEDYQFAHNDVCGNFSSEYGGGMSHWGLSPRARIHDNRFYFNDSVDEGGGLLIGGDPGHPGTCPNSEVTDCTLGSGSGRVTVERNLFQANLANDDGGGIRLLRPLTSRIDIINNEIVNNVTTDHGGGISLDDASDVRIVNNTIADNVSTHTAEDAIRGEAHSAGISTEFHSAGFTPTDGSAFSDPVLFNNILYDNLAYRWDEFPAQPGVFGLIPTAFIDLEVFGGDAGDCLDVAYSFLSGPYLDGDGFACPLGPGNIVADGVPPALPLPTPEFVFPLPADRVEIQVTSGRFNPAELVPFLDRKEGTLVGYTNYHLLADSLAIDAGTAGPISTISPPNDDIDLDVRPQSATWDMGSDEFTANAEIAVLQFGAPEYLAVEGTDTTVTVTVTLTGGSGGDVTVDYGFDAALSSATAGQDFEPFGGTLEWLGGDTTPKSFTVTIINDQVFEPAENEVLFLTLSNVTGDAALVNGQPTLFAELSIVDDDPNPVPTAALYFSTATNVAVPGLSPPPPFDDADIYAWDGAGGYTRVFDATAAGLPGSADIDAMVVDASGVGPEGTGFVFYMSFRAASTNVPQVGAVTGSDIVRYDSAANTWTMFLDGSDVGLTGTGHNIDAFEILSQNQVLISMTTASPDIVTGDQDEDLLLCSSFVSGSATSCTWSLYFDGSDSGIRLNNNGTEDVDGAAVSGSDIYLTTNGAFDANGSLTGDGNDVFVCNGAATVPGGSAGVTTTCTSITLFFDFGADNIDAIDVP